MTDPHRPRPRPDLIVLLGDQVYADNTSAKVRRFLRRRRRGRPPGPGRPGRHLRRIHEALPGVVARPGDPLAARHRAERDDLRRPRAHRRLEHLGRLARRHGGRSPGGRSGSPAASPPTGSTSTWATWRPDELKADPLFQQVSTAGDATVLLHDFGRTVDSVAFDSPDPRYQWSFALDLGRTRLVMLDNRCNRVLTPAPGRCCRPTSGRGSSTRPTATTTTWSSAARCPG